jgi:hypothetical protein
LATAYAHVDNGKLEPRASKGVFLGYGSGVKAYKLWNPDTQKAFYSRNIVFNESAMFTSAVSTSATNQNSESISVQVEHVGMLMIMLHHLLNLLKIHLLSVPRHLL